MKGNNVVVKAIPVDEHKEHDIERRISVITYAVSSSDCQPRRKHVFARLRSYAARFPLSIRYLLFALACLLCIVTIMLLSCVFILMRLKSQLKPQIIPSGFLNIARQWTSPLQSSQLIETEPDALSGSIKPIQCHSHNDYWRRVPVFDALSAGCISIEADIWLPTTIQNISSTELLVGHRPERLTANRTLNSLFLNPLLAILARQNHGRDNSTSRVGVFDLEAGQTLVLLLDFKQNARDLWPLVNTHLQPLRDLGYLRYWNETSGKIVPGPITIVASGFASEALNLITVNNTYRDIFADAPLQNLDENSKYDLSNSYYASSPLSLAVGKIAYSGMTSGQKQIVQQQVKVATKVGLVSRYWDTPAWPISLRTKVWKSLVERDVGVLNVDDLVASNRWNWDYCSFLGVRVCGW